MQVMMMYEMVQVKKCILVVMMLIVVKQNQAAHYTLPAKINVKLSLSCNQSQYFGNTDANYCKTESSCSLYFSNIERYDNQCEMISGCDIIGVLHKHIKNRFFTSEHQVPYVSNQKFSPLN